MMTRSREYRPPNKQLPVKVADLIVAVEKKLAFDEREKAQRDAAHQQELRAYPKKLADWLRAHADLVEATKPGEIEYIGHAIHRAPVMPDEGRSGTYSPRTGMLLQQIDFDIKHHKQALGLLRATTESTVKVSLSDATFGRYLADI